MSFSFNGSTDRIDWAAVADLTAHALTISAWVYSDGQAGNADYITAIQNSADNGTGIVLSLVSGVAPQLSRNGTTLLYKYATKDLFSFTGAWHHVIATHDGTINDWTTIHLHIGGEEATVGAAGQNGASEIAPTGKWTIGGRTYDDARNFDGLIAEVGWWDAVLDAGHKAALAAGDAPSLHPDNLVFYFSGKADDLTAEVGGEGTADGAVYNAAHPTITYNISTPKSFAGGDTPTGTVTKQIMKSFGNA
jgi:hypothetical protein